MGKLRELLPASLDYELHFVFRLLADNHFFVQVLVHQLSDVPLKMLHISWTGGSLVIGSVGAWLSWWSSCRTSKSDAKFIFITACVKAYKGIWRLTAVPWNDRRLNPLVHRCNPQKPPNLYLGCQHQCWIFDPVGLCGSSRWSAGPPCCLPPSGTMLLGRDTALSPFIWLQWTMCALMP